MNNNQTTTGAFGSIGIRELESEHGSRSPRLGAAAKRTIALRTALQRVNRMGYELGPVKIASELARQDTAELKEREADLKKEQERLARLEANLAEQTARCRETTGELEMFSYSVAHDMRAPLRAMAGFAQILTEDFGNDLPAEARGHAAHISAAAARMDLLIQDVLTYTKVLHSELKTSVVDLDSLVREVIQSYPQLHSARATIEIQGPLPKVLGHPAALAQAVSNILTNAVKFVAAGVHPRVTVRAVEHGSCVRLWIEDNGIGIEAKNHKRIFGMFERVSNDYGGTGIGLTIVRKSVERLRGAAGVESELGQGSKFWLEFRRITGEAPSCRGASTL